MSSSAWASRGLLLLLLDAATCPVCTRLISSVLTCVRQVGHSTRFPACSMHTFVKGVYHMKLLLIRPALLLPGETSPAGCTVCCSYLIGRQASQLAVFEQLGA